ncbi:hypothetical protein KAS79_02940 [Candidatus Parcubacteria bacterium]|nr:hypothetical protein [Candidatus Parcubacteria bacterium]
MNRSSQKILITLLTLSFIGIGLILPIHSAHAFLSELIAGAFLSISLLILGMVSEIILTLSGILLQWVISPGFIDLSYVNPAGNPVIAIGWTLMRDLANMGLIIVLAYMGLATSLRLGGFETKKILIRLIEIALLINFTPVICGLIVDASNVIMNFFLSELNGGRTLTGQFSAYTNIVTNEIGSLGAMVNPLNHIPLILKLIVLVFFNLKIALLFILYAWLFLIRYVAIWFLVIVSPFAFLCYILPTTKNIFDQWWKNFIQWSIIGIPAAFCFYVGEQIMAMLSKNEIGIAAVPHGGKVTAAMAGWLSEILPYGVVTIFLLLGLAVGMTSTAAGANWAIATGTKGMKWGGKWLGRTTVRAPGKASETIKKTAQRLEVSQRRGLKGVKPVTWANDTRDWTKRRQQEVEKRIGTKPIIGKDKIGRKAAGAVGGVIGGAIKGAKTYIPPREDIPIIKEIFPTQLQEEIKIEQLKGKYKKEAAKSVTKNIDGALRIIRKKTFTDEQKARKAAYIDALLEAYPNMAKEFGKTVAKVLDETTPKNFAKNTRPEALKNEDLFWKISMSQLKAMAKDGSKEQKDAIVSILPAVKKSIEAMEDKVDKKTGKIIKKGRDNEKAVELSDKVLMIKEEF